MWSTSAILLVSDRWWNRLNSDNFGSSILTSKFTFPALLRSPKATYTPRFTMSRGDDMCELVRILGEIQVGSPLITPGPLRTGDFKKRMAVRPRV